MSDLECSEVVYLKICFITNLYKPFIFGGTENSVRNLAEGLSKKGHDVFVITTSPTRKTYVEVIDGIKIYRLFPFNLYPMYTSAKQPFFVKPFYYVIDLWNPSSYYIISKILKCEHPDIVHVNNFRGLSLSLFSAIKKQKVPFIFTARDYSLICPKSSLLKKSMSICHNPPILCKCYSKIQKYFVDNKPDLVTAASQFVLDKLNSNRLFEKTPKIVVPNAVELNINTHKFLEKDTSSINILYVGGLNKHKGVQVLLEAFKQIKYENIKLDIIGKGTYENELKNIAGNDKRIIFHGFKNSNDLIPFYKHANLSIVPSIWYEPFGLVIIESFKYKVPVIGSSIGGIPSIIIDGYNGLLYEPTSAIDLQDKIEYLIANPSILYEFSENALESAKKYELDQHIDNFELIFKNVANKNIIVK
ncbi:Glycosyltransferase involved in cell wall bisynthesis [Methanolobus vulcani]|uniref:Glycosyltransferase involved in cell wall bisynthesis n=1 Tax=Methanolobus vulcani TaxID=38026 RepID=A0A7Z7AX77_9EURY|nr:glycosyltransferase family 4 protein [Methanolobus vulcani]SDF23764.1 Glycosyltransferase involved in cell wall bisynthesis [Methanolobus vulcani]